MYIAMNRFTILDSRKDEFEEVWRTRNSQLGEVPGFKSFSLLKGEESDGKRIYISHSNWETKEDFFRWTESESFKVAHREKRTPEGILQGPPSFEGFEVVLTK